MINGRKTGRYRTEKLTFAAYLIASGKARLMRTEPTGLGRQVSFVLDAIPSAEDIGNFFNGCATISAIRYAEALNLLKSAAHEGVPKDA